MLFCFITLNLHTFKIGGDEIIFVRSKAMKAQHTWRM